MLHVDATMLFTLIRGKMVHVFVWEMFDTGLVLNECSIVLTTACVELLSVQTLGMIL